MFRRLFCIAALLGAFLLLTAMGGTGGVERAPRVEKNYTVVVTDASGVRIEGEKFSWEGRIHFAGNIGMMQVTIPFDKIKELTVQERRDRFMKVAVRLIDGTETSFDIDAKTRCYGEAKFGTFTLMIEELKSIVFKR